MFSKWCTCTIFKPSQISWCVDKCIIEGWWWHSETSEITILCSKQTQRHFWSVLSCSKKTLYFVPIACQCMLANCGANTHRQVWNAYVLHITMPIELCITYPEMLVFAHTKPLCQDIWCRAKKQLASIFYVMHIFIQLFCSIASNVWCFLQIFIFLQLFNTPVWRPNAVVVREMFRSLRLISIAFV